MSSIKLYKTEKTGDDILKTILTNIVKMLTERGLINKQNLSKNISTIISNLSDDQMYNIKLDNFTDDTDKIFYIKLIPQKITAVNKASGISDFLTKYKNNPKLVVAKSVGTKATQFIKLNYPKTELFIEDDLMINLIEHDLVPKHILLSQEEGKITCEKYNCKKKNLPKMLISDPVAKYYNAKVGDIFKIIRPSETAGFVPSYRLVVKGVIK